MLDTIYLGVKGLRNNPFHQKIVEIYSATQRQGDQYVHVKQSYRMSQRPNADQSWQKSIQVLQWMHLPTILSMYVDLADCFLYYRM